MLWGDLWEKQENAVLTIMDADMPSWRELDQALILARRRIRRVGAGVAICAWLAGGFTWLLLFVILDHALDGGVPDAIRRPASILFWLATGAWMVLALGRPLARQLNDLYIARLIEHDHPRMRNTLVDAIQIARRTDVPGSVRSAVLQRAGEELAAVDPLRSVPTRGLRRASALAVGVLALLILYGAMSSKDVLPSLARALGMPLPAPTRVRIVELAPEDGASVLTGRPVEFRAALAGRRPNDVHARFSLDGGKTWVQDHFLPLSPGVPVSDPSGWRATKPGADVRQSMVWQIVAGDAVSENRRLEVRPVPVVTDVQVRYDQPIQSGAAPTTRPGGDVEAAPRTQVTIVAKTNVPAFNPLLILGQGSDERRRVLEAPADGKRELRIPLVVTRDDDYRIEFRDAHGEPNSQAIRYAIRVRPATDTGRQLQSAPALVEQPTTAPADESAALDSPAEDETGEQREAVRLAKSDVSASGGTPGSDSAAPEMAERIPGSQPTASEPSLADKQELADIESTTASQPGGLDWPTDKSADEKCQSPGSAPAESPEDFARRHEEPLRILAERMLADAGDAASEPGLATQCRARSGDSKGDMENPSAAAQTGAGSASGASEQGQSDDQSDGQGGRPCSGQSAEAADGQQSSSGAAGESGRQGQGQSEGSSQGGGAIQPTDSPQGAGTSAGGGDGTGPAPASGPGEGPGEELEVIAQRRGSHRAAPTVGQARQVIDALERALRRGDTDPALLEELGWDLQAAQQFVKEFKRTASASRPAGNVDVRVVEGGPRSEAASIESPGVLRAGRAAAPGLRGLRESDTRPADDTRGLMEVGRQRVPPRYEFLLEAYYRTLASQPAR
ncbi:MAG TPA: hypothetical protein VLM89_03470 [Phycisphaerae bacterium]|nr:hypothetical protein [Phycisphaerae bacterium]